MRGDSSVIVCRTVTCYPQPTCGKAVRVSETITKLSPRFLAPWAGSTARGPVMHPCHPIDACGGGLCAEFLRLSAAAKTAVEKGSCLALRLPTRQPRRPCSWRPGSRPRHINSPARASSSTDKRKACRASGAAVRSRSFVPPDPWPHEPTVRNGDPDVFRLPIDRSQPRLAPRQRPITDVGLDAALRANHSRLRCARPIHGRAPFVP